jgi:hypothetical protein
MGGYCSDPDMFYCEGQDLTIQTLSSVIVTSSCNFAFTFLSRHTTFQMEINKRVEYKFVHFMIQLYSLAIISNFVKSICNLGQKSSIFASLLNLYVSKSLYII